MSILVLPLEGRFSEVLVPSVRRFRSERVLFVHSTPAEGSVHENAVVLSDFFSHELSKLWTKARFDGSSKDQAIPKNVKVEVVALGVSSPLIDVSRIFASLLLSMEAARIDVILLNRISHAYVYGSMLAQLLKPNIHCHVASVGFDIRDQSPHEFQPSSPIEQSIAEVPTFNLVASALEWLRSAPAAASVLKKASEWHNDATRSARSCFKTADLRPANLREQGRFQKSLLLLVTKQMVHRNSPQEYRLTDLGRMVGSVMTGTSSNPMEDVPEEVNEED